MSDPFKWLKMHFREGFKKVKFPRNEQKKFVSKGVFKMHFKLFFHTLGVVENDPAHPGPPGQVWVFHTADEGTRKGDERARGAEGRA